MPDNLSPETMPLEEFISQPSTIGFHVVYSARVQDYLEENPNVRLGAILAGGFAILYTDLENLRSVSEGLRQDYLSIIPQVYTVMGREDLYHAGILQVSQLPTLDLKGKGVIVGFVDTGIDYTNQVFQYEDGTSKILSIWDQTLEGTPPEGGLFGAEFTQEQINEALRSTDPFTVVPQRDTVGHGTFLASLACGRETGMYAGAAPDAEIIAVKLKRASPDYLNVLQVPPEQQEAYASTDILLGLKYILDEVGKLQEAAALVICIGLGTNGGGHDGYSILEQYITHISRRPGIIFCTAAGDEATARHHTERTMQQGEIQSVDIRVAQTVRGFSVWFISSIRDRMSVSLISPTGEVIERVPFGKNVVYRRNLLLERSTVSVFYSQTNVNAAVIQILLPTPGIWRVNIHGDAILDGRFHAWLPIRGLVDPGVEFITPIPNYTIVLPSTSMGAIVAGAYNGRNNSPYISSSWGPTRDGRISPDFVAPGVEVSGIFPGNRNGTMTGTSIAAALTAGACALLMQWGAVEGRIPGMTSEIARSILILGCTREAQRSYPNAQWGYGKLNLIQSFYRMRER